jgi:hypothetical protein
VHGEKGEGCVLVGKLVRELRVVLDNGEKSQATGQLDAGVILFKVPFWAKR